MIRMLEIQKKLIDDGLDKVVSDLKLICKIKGNLVLLKYRQIEADYSIEAVQECRGIILDSSDCWKVVNYTFHKFFNFGESRASQIDWATTKIYEKRDGSLIQIFKFDGEWRMATSGTIDGDGETGFGVTIFNELVKQTVKKCYSMEWEEFTSYLNDDYCYAFEITSPLNVVVVQYQRFILTLLAVRNLKTLEEESIECSKYDFFIRPMTYNLSTIEEINRTFDNMTWNEEGYVIVDKNFDRIKIKNPKYVAVHILKSNQSPYEIINVIKLKEIDEFCVYFKEKEEFVKKLDARFKRLEDDLIDLFVGKLDNFDLSQKEFAIRVFEHVKQPFCGVMFKLRSGKISTIRDGLCELDNRFLYEHLDAKSLYF